MITDLRVKNILANQTQKFFSPAFAKKLQYIDYKFVETCPSVEMAIFDERALFVSTHKERRMRDMTWLYCNNPFIVEMANGYFETLWSTAKDGQERTYKNSEPKKSLLANN